MLRALIVMMHGALQRSLQAAGRCEPNAALQWWRNAELNPAQHASCLMLIKAARAFLAMQASSASAERLFSSAGNNESGNRHNQPTETMEMQLVIRKFVLSALSAGDIDPSAVDTVLLSNTSEMFRDLVYKVAGAVARAKVT